MGIFGGTIHRMFGRAEQLPVFFSRDKDAVNENIILFFREASSREKISERLARTDCIFQTERG